MGMEFVLDVQRPRTEESHISLAFFGMRSKVLTIIQILKQDDRVEYPSVFDMHQIIGKHCSNRFHV